MAEVSFYVKLRPVWGRQSYNRDRLEKVVADGITQKRPDRSAGPVVKLTLNIPDGAFKPLAPEVTIEIPEEAIDYEPKVTVHLPDVLGGGS